MNESSSEQDNKPASESKTLTFGLALLRWVAVLPVSALTYFVVQLLAVLWMKVGGLITMQSGWVNVLATVIIFFSAGMLGVLVGTATAPRFRIFVGWLLAILFISYHLLPLVTSWDVGNWVFRVGNIAAMVGATGGAMECHKSTSNDDRKTP